MLMKVKSKNNVIFVNLNYVIQIELKEKRSGFD